MSGLKFDKGKRLWHLLPFDLFEDLIEIYEFGISKGYPENNWRDGFEYSRLIDATLRHFLAFVGRDDYDRESNKHHLLHAMWNLLTLYYCIKYNKGNDDRVQSLKGEKE